MHEIKCHQCDILFGVPEHWYLTRRQDGVTFWCPNGHGAVFIHDSEKDKLRRERDQLKQSIAMWQDEARIKQELIEAAHRTAAAYKGQVTRLKKRASVGLCPCCNRSFAQLRAHMRTQHPEYIIDSNVVELKAS